MKSNYYRVLMELLYSVEDSVSTPYHMLPNKIPSIISIIIFESMDRGVPFTP